MSGNRRPGKRSIIGSRVCAPQPDGLLYAGVILAIQGADNGRTAQTYTVQFDNGLIRTFRESDLVGPGFQMLTAAKLKPGQTVFITQNGREVRGRIESRHTRSDEDDMWTDSDLACGWDEVWVSVGDESKLLRRKVEDVRLMESRKSARLQQDETHQQPADLMSSSAETKKRTVSHVIDVPMLTTKHSRGPGLVSSSYEEGNMMQQYGDVQMYDVSSEHMDEHMAALVLTSLSCSPASPAIPHMMSTPGGKSVGPSTSAQSSGIGTSCSPSPPKCLLSQSAPATVNAFTFMHFDATDDIETDVAGPETKRTLFKCTWPGCGRVYNVCSLVEKHVRVDHLGPRDDSSVDMSDHEEEFYYTEVEETVDTVTQTFADMHTTSPTRTHFVEMSALPDHDYLRKEFRSVPLSIPKPKSHRQHHDVTGHGSTPHETTLSSSLPQDGLSFHAAENASGVPFARSYDYHDMLPHPSHPSKAMTNHRKSRTDVKKCRKVYGIENRAMWCTQCKWKKACNRFHEQRTDHDIN